MLKPIAERWKLPDWLPPPQKPPLVGRLIRYVPTPDPEIAPATMGRSRTAQMKVSPSERWMLAGMTGTGKTTFAKRLMLQMRSLWPALPIYILDSKGQPKDFRSWSGFLEQDAPPRVRWQGGDTVIWRPSHDVLEAYDAWFEAILHARRPAIVYVDELSSISRGNEAVDGYKKLSKQGRGLDIAVITGSQELGYIPRQSIGQMTHFVRFRLLDPYDRRKGNKLLGLDGKHPEPANRYGFYYARSDDGLRRPWYYPSHQAFF